MRRRLTTALIAFAAVVGVAAPAHADTFVVTGTGDGDGGCTLIQPTVHSCTTLRSAVLLANELTGPHGIGLPAGTIQLTTGELDLQRDMTIAGTGARTTSVVAAQSSRAFAIVEGSSVSMSGFTVAGGNVSTDDGGNFLVSPNSTLALIVMRVTGGVASRGAAISNTGTLSIQFSLIDGNTAQFIGGAIENESTPDSRAEVQIVNSTLAGNIAPTGAAVASHGNGQNQVHLQHATVARNTGSAFWMQHAQGTSANASIIGPNVNGPTTSDNCDVVSQGAPFSSGSWNVANDATCGLTATTNRQNTDPQLAAALTNQGGGTDVLAIPAGSPAVDLVTPCGFPSDQRLFTRFTTSGQPCDAGAYEQSGVGPDPQDPTPTPTPTQTPSPTPTVTPEPTPVVNQTVVAREVRGTIRVRVPGSNRFVDLDASQGIRVGSTVDARRGTVEITSVPRAGRPVEKAEFRAGIFRVTQARGITDLKLTEKLSCPRRANAAQRKPKKRKLWGKGTGKFRTTGSYSAATIRGTEWLVQDTCTTTLTRVKVGVVSVRDKVKKRTIIRRAGQRYVARARR